MQGCGLDEVDAFLYQSIQGDLHICQYCKPSPFRVVVRFRIRKVDGRPRSSPQGRLPFPSGPKSSTRPIGRVLCYAVGKRKSPAQRAASISRSSVKLWAKASSVRARISPVWTVEREKRLRGFEKMPRSMRRKSRVSLRSLSAALRER